VLDLLTLILYYTDDDSHIINKEMEVVYLFINIGLVRHRYENKYCIESFQARTVLISPKVNQISVI
jgi:hypothetical protein